MKKSLIALAALAASTAFAQSSVTLYGIVDMGFGSLKTTNSSGTNTTVTGFSAQQSVSRFGLRGVEDLGGGLSANFTLEYYIEPDNGSGIGAGGIASSARQAFAGISGGFGSINMGNMTTLIASTNGSSDFHGGTNTVGYTAGMNQNSRRANMIQYSTPSFNGFTTSVQLGFAGTTAGDDTGDSQAVRVTYVSGPLSIGAAHEKTELTKLSVVKPGSAQVADFASRTATDLSNALTDRTRTAYGASYDLGVAKVGFTRSEGKAGTSADRGEFNTTSLGVSVPMGALTLSATADRGDFIDSGAAAAKISGHQLSAYYALSKRTNLYALAGQAKVKSTTEKDRQFTVGMRHQF